MKHWNWIVPLLVCTAILLVLFLYVFPSYASEREYEINKQLRDLESTNMLLIKDNKELASKIKDLTLQADSLQRLIRLDSTVINNLKKKRNEKMDAIITYSTDELYEFFSGFDTISTKTKE